MIRFQLRCGPHGHGFDGWFRSGEDFDRQSERGLVHCPACGSAEVGKALMVPAVGSAKGAVAAKRPDLAAAPPPEAASMFARLQAMAREVRAKADYVGPRFAEEARRIHYGEEKPRQIYGEASTAEVRSLVEEGIPALPMPSLPEDKN